MINFFHTHIKSSHHPSFSQNFGGRNSGHHESFSERKRFKGRDYRDLYVEIVENSLYKVMFARPNVSNYNDLGDIYETRMLDFKTEDIGYVIFTLVQRD